jgi:hypothetical protein
VEKRTKNNLRWFGHEMRREETKSVKVIMNMNVEGRRGRGKPTRRWLDTIENYMRVVGVDVIWKSMGKNGWGLINFFKKSVKNT